jgi:hypothetical protein
MSVEQQRKLLEQLMGKEALYGSLLPPSHFSDDNVCKDYLCGLCPLELFVNTKMDIGNCTKTHSEELRKDYQEAKRLKKHPGYEHQWAQSLGEFIEECDRKIAQTLKKMEKHPDDNKAIQLVP